MVSETRDRRPVHVRPGAPLLPAEARIVALVADGIDSGRFTAGCRLPTERHLATANAVSRSAVRRGLAVLEARGLISRHVGRGTFIRSPVSAAVAPAATELANATSPFEIMEVRLMLEPQIAALAASNATGAEVDFMRRCLVEAENAAAIEGFETWDGTLHAAIARATHNEFLLRIFDVIHTVRDEPLWGSLKRRSFTAARRRDYERDHRRIVEAVAQRDGELARRLMREHVARVRANLFDLDRHDA